MTIAQKALVPGGIELQHLIDGRWVEGRSDGTAAVSTNPATSDDVVGTYVTAGVDLLDEALAAARNSQREWAELGIIRRGRILRRAADLLSTRTTEIATLMTVEEGKTHRESLGEVGAAVETLYYQAEQARAPIGQTFASSNPDELIRTLRRPVGTVAVITPWNFPVQIPIWKIAPALLWGNSVVWKSASEVPVTSVAVAEVFVDAGVPAGVLNLLLTPGSIGARLVSSPSVAAVTFTGSVQVGRQIAATACERGAKVQLELGGHNAAVVLPDVNPAAVAADLVFGAMGSTGQKCTATRRIIAVGTMYESLQAELAARVNELQIGDGMIDAIEIGPLVSRRARDEVGAALAAARNEGATVLAAANETTEDGAFYTPTLLTGSPDLTVCHDEVFGPITTLLQAEDLDHAIEIANSTAFGLTASVFSSNEKSVRRCIDELEAGIVKANAPTTGSELHVPFGGLKDSSFPAPREQNGATSADFFTWSKSAYLRTTEPWTS